MSRFIHTCLLLLVCQGIFSQTILNATGDGNTYELITSVLAPGANPIETPDCAHPEFGDHIDMVFDSDLNVFVFRFYMHTSPDNDRCINYDRQRNEIKTYSESSDSLLGVTGEIVEYKWKFMLEEGFQSSSSFTHLHQLKAVGGTEESMPLITLTARKGTPDKLELRYAEHLDQETIYEADLSPFLGNWVQVVETVSFGEQGSYTILITRVDNQELVFEYTNNSIRMWKTDAEFIRPKWGIYRSLNHPEDLRDEEVRFANFIIEELVTAGLAEQKKNEIQLKLNPNPAKNTIFVEFGKKTGRRLLIYDLTGRLLLEKEHIISGEIINLSALNSGVYMITVETDNGPISGFFSKI